MKFACSVYGHWCEIVFVRKNSLIDGVDIQEDEGRLETEAEEESEDVEVGEGVRLQMKIALDVENLII